MPGVEHWPLSVLVVAQATRADGAVAVPEFPTKPSWREVFGGLRPPQPDAEFDEEPGQWPHGWQFYASLGLITRHREHAVLPNLDAAAQARLRSQSGAHAGDHITALPMSDYTVATPLRMNGMLRRRARLPIATGSLHCRAARCQRSGTSRLDHRSVTSTAIIRYSTRTCAAASRLTLSR